jgi:hypothetical protein
MVEDMIQAAYRMNIEAEAETCDMPRALGCGVRYCS